MTLDRTLVASTMNNEAHDRVRQLFDRASELSGAQREAFLIRECAADADLLRRLRAMLAAAADQRFLTAPETPPD